MALTVLLYPSQVLAQSVFNYNGITYKVIKDANEASNYGTVAVTAPRDGFYEGMGLPQKAKSFIEEGWRTFLSNEDVPIPTDFYNTLVESVVRIYLACGEKDKAVAFINKYAEDDQEFPW